MVWIADVNWEGKRAKIIVRLKENARDILKYYFGALRHDGHIQPVLPLAENLSPVPPITTQR